MDHASLHWVRNEIEDTLSQARRQLEEFVEGDRAGDSMPACIALLHDVRGVLEMLEVYGVSLLTEEMEALATALSGKKIRHLQEGAEILMRALIQLPEYLEYLRGGNSDSPFVLLPLLNDLRAVQGKQLLSENVIFHPNLDAPLLTDLSTKPIPRDARFRSLARQLRPFYLKGLVGWFNQARPEQGLGLIRAVFEHLEDLSGNQPLARLWWIAAGVVEALENGSLKSGVTIKLLLGRVDAYVKKLVDEGKQALSTTPAPQLQKNLLYYLALPDSKGKRVEAARKAFSLHGLLPGEDERVAAQRSLAGPNLDALASVSDALKDDLAKVKDGLDTFVRNENATTDDLSPLPPILRRVADTLGLLSLGIPRKVVIEQHDHIEKILQTRQVPSEEEFMSVAGALLSVDSALDALATEGVEKAVEKFSADSPEPDLGDTLLSGVEYLQLVTTVIGEAKADLAVVKDAISTYIVEPESSSRLAEIPQRVKHIEGSLRMLSLQPAADLLVIWGKRVDARLVNARDIPDASVLDGLADAVVTLEYYLEAVAEARPGADDILAAAQDRLGTFLDDPGEPREPIEQRASPTTAAEEDTTSIDAEGAAMAESLSLPSASPSGRSTDTQASESTPEIEPAPSGEAIEVGMAPMAVGARFAPQAGTTSGDETVAETAIPTLDMPDPLRQTLIDAKQRMDQMEPATTETAEPPLGSDPEIVEIFLEEAAEVHQTLSEHMPKWAREPDNQESLTTIRRAFHTLKGSGRMAGAITFGEFALSVENMLNRVIDRVVPLTPEIVNLVIQAQQELPQLLAEVRGSGDATSDMSAFNRRAQGLGTTRAPMDNATPPLWQAAPTEAGSTHAEPSLETPTTEKKSPADSANAINPDSATILKFPATQSEISTEPDLQDQLLAVFRDEAIERIDALKQQLKAEEGWRTGEQLAPAFHTLCGSARTAGLNAPADLCAAVETWLLTGGPNSDSECLVTPESPHGRKTLFAAVSALETAVVDLPKGPADVFHTLRTEIAGLWVPVATEPAKQEPPDLASTEQDVLRQIFFEEAHELLQATDETVQRLRKQPKDGRLLAELQRNLHTLKGGARMTRFEHFGTLSHALESLLTLCLGDENGIQPDMLDLTERCHDRLAELLESSIEGRPAPAIEGLTNEISSWLKRADDDGFAAGAFDPVVESDEITELFFAEAEQMLQRSDERLAVLSSDPSDQQALADLRREMHSLKGAARMVGAEALGELSHCAESLLELACDDYLKVSTELLRLHGDVLQQSRGMIAEVRAHLPVADPADLVGRMDALVSPGLGGGTAHAPGSVQAPTDEAANTLQPATAQATKSRSEFVERIGVDAELLDNLVNFAGEISITQSRIKQHSASLRYNLEEMDQAIARLKDQLRRLEIEAESQIVASGSVAPAELRREEFDPLEFDRYTRVQQISRGLMETIADLTSIRDLLSELNRESDTILVQQARINTNLQDGLMRTRMLPFSRYVPRFRRLVRGVAQELDKDVALTVTGNDINIDRAVMNRILAPLEHMLRNAVDHGIEPAPERLRERKPTAGAVELNIIRDGATVVVEVVDDGQGMDRDAIAQQAITKGLMTAGADLTDEELLQFVLEPEFTTAAKLTQISGRGVGMDVVNTEIRQLGGTLAIESTRGRGTKFVLRLPLTLTINQALMVGLREEMFAIPLTSVEAVVRLNRRQLDEQLASETPVFIHLGLKYQFVYLGSLLDIGDMDFGPDDERFPLVLVRAGEHRMAFSVDKLGVRQEVVVKSVGPQLSSIRWFTGATIQGDGRVVLVLDIAALVRMGVALHGAVRLKTDEADAAKAIHVPTVLVVDDSITVRKVTERFLARHGLKVITARDGLEALAILQEQVPDVMLLDVEMPRMDGFELATTVRNDQRLESLPIIMITSRTGEKHSERAIQIGVDRYLGKPYHEAELLANIHELIEVA